MKTTDPIRPDRPATIVPCAWCDGPIELDPESDQLNCPACRVTVELWSTSHPAQSPHTLASAA